jgi:DNA-binding NtrC family response regulator
VAQGTFRQDLYSRLNVLSLRLPPLRERRADVAALALFFARKLSQRMKRVEAGLSPGALHKLLSHDWPGNVRELKHVIERALIVSASQVLGEADIDLPDDTGAAAAQVSLRTAKAQVVAQFERSFIEQLLTVHGGNVTHAAQSAGKNRRAFFALMRKYRIEAARFRESEPQAG